MDRARSSRCRLPSISLRAALLAPLAIGCAGTGPPLVQHPRSSPMTAVSPELDPLACARGREEGRAEGAAVATQPPSLGPEPPPSSPPPPEHVALEQDEWSLALAPDETSSTVSPPIAFDAALWMSAGPAPRLSRAA